MTGDARPAPPAAPGSLRPLAPLARRLAALVYEGLVLSAIVVVTGFLTVPFSGPVDPAAPALRLPGSGGRVAAAAIVLAVAGVYYTWSWSGGRRTLPMKTWRIALVRADGRTVDPRSAALRYLAAWIGPMAALAAYASLKSPGLGAHAAWLVALNYLWAFIDRDRQFLHDRIAGTRLVM